MIGSVTMSGPSYVSGAYKSAVNNSIRAGLNPGAVEAVKKVPKVFSNENTERIKKTPEEEENARNDAFQKMKAGSIRNAENINGFKLPGNSEEEKTNAEERADKRSGVEECETCKNRKYVDGSNENDVSFKTPGHIDPSASASTVMAHEQQHVANAVQEGNEEGAELVAASVTLETDICPECGKAYVSGGETRTTIRHTEQVGTEVQATTPEADKNDMVA